MKPESPYRKRNLPVVAAISVGTLLVMVVMVVLLTRPGRSVAAYCKVYKQEDAKLAGAKGETYSSAIFAHRSSRPTDFANAFSKLDQVAPTEIEPDVIALKSVYEKIANDPAQALSASTGGLAPEASVKAWTADHCGLIQTK